jgi:hypothetical protein
MAYGHAERNLAFICQLEAETSQLLDCPPQPEREQPASPPVAGRKVTARGRPPRAMRGERPSIADHGLRLGEVRSARWSCTSRSWMLPVSSGVDHGHLLMMNMAKKSP